MSNLKVLKIGTEFILEAVSFTQQKNIERSAPSIQWTITPKGGAPEKIGTGKAINYKITDKYAGKEVVFRAFIKEDSYKMYPQQRLTCFIEEKVSTEGILIEKVGKSGSEKVGGTIECKVTQYNKPFDKITEAQKRAIKWDVKTGSEEKKIFTNSKSEPFRGENIKFTVPESWKGKNILVMPYMNQSTEKTAANLKVEIDPTTIGKSCGIEYRDSITCVKYNSNYGPKYGGSITLNDYSSWNILLDSNKITLEEQSIIMGVSENEGNLDAVQSYDSEIVTVGAMQKTINPDGYGEFPTQMAEFKDEHPDLFEQLFTNCSWSVQKENNEWRAYYNNKTGQDLKDEIRENCSESTYKKKIKAIPIEPLINAAKNEVFQSKQIYDFISRLNNRVLKVIPLGYNYSLKEYMKSKLGKATVLDQHVNRPAHVATDFGKALDNFFKKNPRVSKNPSEWGKKHSEYEKSILDDYGVNRRGTDMAGRYEKMVNNEHLK